jgi:hypothetical protein
MVRSYPCCFGDADFDTTVCTMECPYYNRCLTETFMRSNPELVLLIDDGTPLSLKMRHDAIRFVEKCWVKKI